ncbi:MAG: hypothetical protein P8M67_02145 [Opitutales bacterium]|nr:hypothetical protein [Opitutales bacterium]
MPDKNLRAATNFKTLNSDFSQMGEKMQRIVEKTLALEGKINKLKTSGTRNHISDSNLTTNIESKLITKENSASLTEPIDQKPASTSYNLEKYNIKETNLYTLRLLYGVCSPLDVDLQSYTLEQNLGHHAQLQFTREFGKFIVGGSWGAKFLENKTLTMQWNPGEFRVPVTGKSYSTYTSILLGFEHYLNDSTFISTKIAGGAGWSWDEIFLGNVKILNADDGFFFGSFQIGLGYRLFEHFSTMLYYQFDAYGERHQFDHNLFNQFGIAFAVHY